MPLRRDPFWALHAVIWNTPEEPGRENPVFKMIRQLDEAKRTVARWEASAAAAAAEATSATTSAAETSATDSQLGTKFAGAGPAARTTPAASDEETSKKEFDVAVGAKA